MPDDGSESDFPEMSVAFSQACSQTPRRNVEAEDDTGTDRKSRSSSSVLSPRARSASSKELYARSAHSRESGSVEGRIVGRDDDGGRRGIGNTNGGVNGNGMGERNCGISSSDDFDSDFGTRDRMINHGGDDYGKRSQIKRKRCGVSIINGNGTKVKAEIIKKEKEQESKGKDYLPLPQESTITTKHVENNHDTIPDGGDHVLRSRSSSSQLLHRRKKRAPSQKTERIATIDGFSYLIPEDNDKEYRPRKKVEVCGRGMVTRRQSREIEEERRRSFGFHDVGKRENVKGKRRARSFERDIKVEVEIGERKGGNRISAGNECLGGGRSIPQKLSVGDENSSDVNRSEAVYHDSVHRRTSESHHEFEAAIMDIMDEEQDMMDDNAVETDWDFNTLHPVREEQFIPNTTTQTRSLESSIIFALQGTIQTLQSAFHALESRHYALQAQYTRLSSAMDCLTRQSVEQKEDFGKILEGTVAGVVQNVEDKYGLLEKRCEGVERRVNDVEERDDIRIRNVEARVSALEEFAERQYGDNDQMMRDLVEGREWVEERVGRVEAFLDIGVGDVNEKDGDIEQGVWETVGIKEESLVLGGELEYPTQTQSDLELESTAESIYEDVVENQSTQTPSESELDLELRRESESPLITPSKRKHPDMDSILNDHELEDTDDDDDDVDVKQERDEIEGGINQGGDGDEHKEDSSSSPKNKRRKTWGVVKGVVGWLVGV